METNILLESGTNELEILVFNVGNNYYGINVAKISEIIPYQKPTPIPNGHPCIEGIFMPRDTIFSIINLAKCLNFPEPEDCSKDMYIITNFNNLHTAFHVQGVQGINRVSWADIVTPDTTINSSDRAVATGIIKCDGKLIIILDFEKIVSEINPETGLKVSDVDHIEAKNRSDFPIMIAEDSPLLSSLICDCLHKAGFKDIIVNSNGKEAWDKLVDMRDNGTIDSKVKLVITDIEMPQMDGHRLTKLIKEDMVLQHIPVIIFSSLINAEMRRKGEALGADAQLTKPEIGSLVLTIDGLLGIK